MKIGMLVSHPTQFEAPLFRYASQDRTHSLRVIYWDERRARAIVDPELHREIHWGIDLFGGYSSTVIPVMARVSRLCREIRNQRFDLLVVNGYNHWMLIVAVVVARCAGSAVALRLDSVKTEAFVGVRGWAKRWILPMLFRRYHAFLAVSSLTRQYLIEQNVPSAAIHYFTYSVDQAWFRAGSSLTDRERAEVKQRYGLSSSKKLVLAIAKLTPRETPWDLLHVAAILDRRDVEFLIVGDGEDRERVMEAARHAKVHVVLPGYVSYPDLPSLYGVADVFVHAPRREPYGVSVAEALSCGVAVVASSTVGAARDLIVQGHNGFVYEFGEARQLMECLIHALDELDRSRLRDVSNGVLKQWDYETTWKSILQCARRLRPGEAQ